MMIFHGLVRYFIPYNVYFSNKIESINVITLFRKKIVSGLRYEQKKYVENNQTITQTDIKCVLFLNIIIKLCEVWGTR